MKKGVENGRLTQEEADEKLTEIEERVTAFVNEGPPERPEGARPGGRHHGRHGVPGGGPGGPEA